MKTVAAGVEDLLQVIDAADQLQALVSLLEEHSPMAVLLTPIEDSFAKALYGPSELANAVEKASGRDEEKEAHAAKG
ncbi:hypothetical protein MYX75_02830 [Acidobacteria bacterium AH-259-A15]|nr:hypothetical protein [Acidobacteria bacterium AH-259-A15]